MRTYKYILELVGGDGRTIGEVPIDPDWEPALEWAAFDALRRGRVPTVWRAPSGHVEPVWHPERGRPCVAGFLIHVDGVESVAELPVAYVARQARAAVATFFESATLRAGDSFSCLVQAFATGSESAMGDAVAFTVDDVASPLPLGDRALSTITEHAVRWGLPPEPDEFPVFISRAVLEEITAQARANPDNEVGGILVGRLHRDPELPDIFLEVTAQIPAQHTTADATRVSFTAETWAAAEAAIALRRRGELMSGWQHSHLDWCRHCPIENRRRCTRSNAFLSADDIHLQRVCFGRAHNVALLVSDNIHTGMTWTLYGWRQGVVSPRGFHIIEQPEENVHA